MTEFVTPNPEKILVIDVSKWQDSDDIPGNIDLEKAKQRGVSGVIIKKGQGLYDDKKFQTTYDEAVRVEIPKGAYWYYDNRVDPTKQAIQFAKDLPVDFLELGIWADFEDRQAGVHGGWKNWYVFLAKLRELLPSRTLIGIYTGYYYWWEYTVDKQIPKASLEWFHQFPLWIAQYHLNIEDVLVPPPWKPNEWTFWQFTDLLDGISYGVESKELDGDYFNGNEEEFREYFKLANSLPERLKLVVLEKDKQKALYEEIP